MHFDSGMVIYSNAEEAVEDLRRRGFTVVPLSTRKSRDITVETIKKLLSWSTAEARQAGRTNDY